MPAVLCPPVAERVSVLTVSDTFSVTDGQKGASVAERVSVLAGLDTFSGTGIKKQRKHFLSVFISSSVYYFVIMIGK